MNANEKQARLAVDKARLWALENVPFYGALAGNLADQYGAVPTACTDGKRIMWGVDYISTLTSEEVRAVLLHETLHCLHGHVWRFAEKDQPVQLACDAVANRIIQRISGCTLPKGAFLAPQFDAMSEEEIVRTLRNRKPGDGEEPQPEPQPGDDGAPGDGDGDGEDGQPSPGDDGAPGDGDGQPSPDPCGDFESPGENSPGDGDKPSDATAIAKERAELAEKWESATERAVIAAGQLAGDIPGDAQRLIDKRRAVQPDWRAALADFIRSSGATRSDYSRSSRRMATAPVIYARRRPASPGTLLIVRDTSGSIGPDTLAEFNALIQGALAETGGAAIVLDADTTVAAEYRLAPGEPLPDTAEGGGGTDFCPAFERAAALELEGETLAGIVYLTDLDGSEPEPESVTLPTLWVCTQAGKVAGCGRTIHTSA